MMQVEMYWSDDRIAGQFWRVVGDKTMMPVADAQLIARNLRDSYEAKLAERETAYDERIAIATATVNELKTLIDLDAVFGKPDRQELERMIEERDNQIAALNSVIAASKAVASAGLNAEIDGIQARQKIAIDKMIEDGATKAGN